MKFLKMERNVFTKIKGDLNMAKFAKMVLDTKEEIIIELFEKDAPGTVANFEKLINQGFYNGLNFHRVIPGFVSQGGCPTGTGTGGPGYKIDCETKGNPNKHEVGSLSMAHAGLNTGGSQFFLCHAELPHLDGVHTVFGKVIKGVEAAVNMVQGTKMEEVTTYEE